MAMLQLDLPDSLRERLGAKAHEAGFGSVEQYATAVLEASVPDEAYDRDLERLIVGRLNRPDPGIEFTPEFQAEFLKDIARRRAERGRR